MNYIVTGGAGFIGSRLADRLIDDGCNVAIIDNLSTGKEKNVNKKALRYLCDIANIDDLMGSMLAISRSFGPIDAVFHFAALPRVQFSVANPIESNNSNATGTLNVLEASKVVGVKRVVYSSSSSVYGDQDTLPVVETMKPNPLSPYALQKLFGEYYCAMYYKLYELKTVSLRYFNVFGPNQDPNSEYSSLIPKFLTKMMKGEKCNIHGDGEQTRDFTFVDNVVDANIVAASCDNEKIFGNYYNIGYGERFSVNQVADLIKKMTKFDGQVDHIAPVVEARHTLAEMSKIYNDMKYIPSVDFKKGMNITYRWYQRALNEGKL